MAFIMYMSFTLVQLFKDCFDAAPLVREIFGTIIRTKRMIKFIKQKYSKKPAKTPEFLCAYSQVQHTTINITMYTLKSKQ